MTMLERVGLDLEEHVRRNGFSSYGDAARVMAKAMRDPNRKMVNAAFSKANVPAIAFLAAWRAGIDAILSEEDGE